MGIKRTFIVFLCLTITGCVSIPKESPQLSQEIGKRVAAMQSSHLQLVSKYFDLKRDKVNEVFEEEWIPAYAKSFFSQDQVAAYWEQLVAEDDKEERLQFLVRLGPRMLEEIRRKRAEFLEPLNSLESEIQDSLRNDYQQILSANNTLTSFLSNSSKVVQNRDRYLDLFGVNQDKFSGYIDEVDERSEQVMELIKQANLN